MRSGKSKSRGYMRFVRDGTAKIAGLPHERLAEIIGELQRRGAELHVELEGDVLREHAVEDPLDIVALLLDREGVTARHWGITVEELRAYRASRGELHCSAKTKKGDRCRGFMDHIDTSYGLEPGEWVELSRTALCRLHERQAQER